MSFDRARSSVFAMTAFLFAGCSGAASAAPAFVPAADSATSTASFRAPLQSVVGAETTPGELFVSDDLTDSVHVFRTGGAEIATIGGLNELPEGLAVDQSGDLYVAQFYANAVLEYANDHQTLLATLADPDRYPGSVGVDPTTGLVGVTATPTKGGPDSVDFFAKGATSRCRRVTSEPYFFISAGAFIRGKFYVVGETATNGPLIGVIAGPGCSATRIQNLTVGNKIDGPAAIQITPAGQIAVLDAGHSMIYTYDQPIDGNLGSPVATTPLAGLNDPRSFAFSQKGAFVYVADQYYSKTYTYAYPAGGNAIKAISSGGSAGIAFFPAAYP
jgi:DNA-binding beta-propeller fold protein YncE